MTDNHNVNRIRNSSSSSASSSPRKIGVHVLSEHVFCPRAGLIAQASGKDTGDEERNSGPRLDMFVHYNEHKFVEAIRVMWGRMRFWTLLLAAAGLVVACAVVFHSRMAGLVLSLPVFVFLAKCWDTLALIIALVREHEKYRAAPEVEFDPNSTEIRSMNWWSLRKAGFDCDIARDPLSAQDGQIIGKPWRILRKGAMAVPVIRRRRGSSDWHPQHIVRNAAYCDLIEKSYTAAAPFGVILFAGTRDCVIVPNSDSRQRMYQQALDDDANFFDSDSVRTENPADNRCAGCPHGMPRQFRTGKSETIANGEPIPARVANSVWPDGRLRGKFHSDCGDHFRWPPPHKDAIALGIS